VGWVLGDNLKGVFGRSKQAILRSIDLRRLVVVSRDGEEELATGG
jgi:hypothetical protein